MCFYKNSYYIVVALVLNLIWYLVLSGVPSPLSEALRSIELAPLEAIALFQIAGLFVAIVFKQRIGLARSWAAILLAIVVPFVAGYVFIVSMLLYKIALGSLGGGDISASLFWGGVIILKSGHIVFPLGLLSQLLMRRVGNRKAKGNYSPPRQAMRIFLTK